MRNRKKVKSVMAILIALLCLLSGCGAKKPTVENNTNQQEQSPVPITLPMNHMPTTYDKILKSLISAFPWNKNPECSVPEFPELSSLYKNHPSLSEIKYALIDLDGNGQEELIITGLSTSYIYDLFTIANGQAVHLFSSERQNNHCMYENGYIENEWSNGSVLNGKDYYKLEKGTCSFVGRITTDLFHAHAVGLVPDLSTAPSDAILFKSTTTESKDYVHIAPSEMLNTMDGFLQNSRPLRLEYLSLSGYAQ